MSEENKTVNGEQNEATENASAKQTEKKVKKTKKDAELEKALNELASTKDLLLRTAAEFDNFKKRTEREKASIAEYAKCNIIKELLPIFDNADRALSAKGGDDYAKGLEMIIRQFAALPQKLSISEVAAVGDTFDPNLHEAVMHVEDETLGENTIAEVLQKGYKFGDTVIRPAMVKVAN